jgi:hypothetical protein
MVHNNQNYWVLGFYPLSGILKIGKHNVSETGSVSVATTSCSESDMGCPLTELSCTKSDMDCPVT